MMSFILFSFQNCGKVGESTEVIQSLSSVNTEQPPNTGDTGTSIIPPQEEPDPTLTNEQRAQICKSYLDKGYTPELESISDNTVNYYVGQDGSFSGAIEPRVNVSVKQHPNATLQSLEVRCELESDDYNGIASPINCASQLNRVTIQRRQGQQFECGNSGTARYKISVRGICNNQTNGTSDDNGTTKYLTVKAYSNCPQQTKIDSGLPAENQRLGDNVDFDGRYIAAAYPGAGNSGGVKLFEKLSNRIEYRGEASVTGNVVGVAVGSNYLAVGTPFVGTGGQVKIYDISTGNPVFKQTLNAQSNSEEFGHAISIDGNIMAVGAPNNMISGNFSSSASGAVHIYELSAGNWSFANTVTLPNRGDSNSVNKHMHNFGYSVGVDTGIIVAGAPVGDKSKAPDKDGSVHIIMKSGGTYKITESKTIGKRYGSSVAISGARILAASEVSDKVHLYNLSFAKQSELSLRPNSGSASVKRVSVSIDGTKAVVGVLHDSATGNNMYAGATYYYDLNQSGKVFKSMAMDRENDQAKYGSDVAIVGNSIVVGSREDDLNTDQGDSLNRTKAGSVYLLDVSSTYLKVLSDQ